MFTGIIAEIGEIGAVRSRGEGLQRFKVLCGFDRATIAEGASIACSGICLTVVATGVENGRTWFAVDTAAETLRVTTAGTWRHGTHINLERSLKVGDELGGHLVAGHVDGVAQVIAREDLTDMARIAVRIPADLARFVAVKGSVALDGVSLTVNEVTDDIFGVMVIPYTLRVTTFGSVRPGDRLNLEVDLIARYAARWLASR